MVIFLGEITHSTLYAIRKSRIIWPFLCSNCSDYHLNSIYIYYCCLVACVLLCHYVYHMCAFYAYNVFACDSTCALLFTEDMFLLMNSRVIKVTV